RILKEPVRCRFSAFRTTWRPVSRENVSLGYAGVTRAIPASRARAAATSAIVGAIELEHLLEDLADRAQRLEFPLLHPCQKPLETCVAGDGFAEMGARAARSDREHLRGEVLPPALLEPPVDRKLVTMSLERGPQLRDVLATERLRQEDRRSPVGLRESDDRTHLVQHRLRTRVVELIDRDHVWNLHDSRLERLHGIARAGHEHEQHGVRDPGHLHLALPRTDRLDEDDVLAGSIEQEHRLQGRLREAAEVPARAHRADVDAGIEEVVREADAIAEERAARERARRVDGDDSDSALLLAEMADERGDKTGLADAWRS